MKKGSLDVLVGNTITNQDEVHMVPDILQNGEDFFFPVFTTSEEMGEYGNDFSKIQEHFLTAVSLARNSEPFVVPEELFDIIAEMDSAIEPKE